MSITQQRMGGRRRDRARSNGRRPYLSKCRVCRRARLAATHAPGVIAHVVAHNRTALAGRAATLGRGCGIGMRAAAPPGCQRRVWARAGGGDTGGQNRIGAH